MQSRDRLFRLTRDGAPSCVPSRYDDVTWNDDLEIRYHRVVITEGPGRSSPKAWALIKDDHSAYVTGFDAKSRD